MTSKAQGCAGWAVAALFGLIAVGQCMGDDPAPPETSAPLALVATTPGSGGPETARQYLYVRAETLNCRASPSTSSETVRRLSDRDLVGVVREENGWAKLSDPACWVRRDYLGSSPRARPVAQPQPKCEVFRLLSQLLGGACCGSRPGLCGRSRLCPQTGS
jgi:hypothetical protein